MKELFCPLKRKLKFAVRDYHGKRLTKSEIASQILMSLTPSELMMSNTATAAGFMARYSRMASSLLAKKRVWSIQP